MFNTDEERSYFLVELPINPYFHEKNKIQDEAQDEAQDDIYLEKLRSLGLNETEIKIIKILKKSELSKKQIALNLGYKSISVNIKKAIQSLLNKKIIQYTLPGKPTSKNQKYKLVKK